MFRRSRPKRVLHTPHTSANKLGVLSDFHVRPCTRRIAFGFVEEPPHHHHHLTPATSTHPHTRARAHVQPSDSGEGWHARTRTTAGLVDGSIDF